MKTLIIDSATNVLYTALVVDEDIIYESYVEGKNDHAKAILVEIDKACRRANTELSQLNRVVVGVGPGSYTGVRMAVTVGKIITTMKEDIELYSISTLLLMASGNKGIVRASIDARRGNAFGCIYDFNHQSYQLEEALVEYEKLNSYPVEHEVNENQYLVDPFVVIQLAKRVEEPRLLTPNYLRQTEAERNLYV